MARLRTRQDRQRCAPTRRARPSAGSGCRASSSGRRRVQDNRPNDRRSSTHGQCRRAPADHLPAASRAYLAAGAVQSAPIAHPKTRRNPPSAMPPRWRHMNHIRALLGILFMGLDPSTLECMTWKGERRCRNGPRIRAQLRWRDKSSAVCRASGGWFYAGIGDGTVRCRAAAFGKFRFFSIEIATAVSRIAHQTVTTCRRTLVRASSQGCVQMHTTQTVSGIGAMARKRRPLRRIVMWRDRATFPDN